MPNAISRILRGTIIIKIKYPFLLRSYPKIKSSYSPGTTARRLPSTTGAHVPGHATSTRKIRPAGQQLDHNITIILPDKCRGRIWFFRQRRFFLEDGLDLIPNKLDGIPFRSNEFLSVIDGRSNSRIWAHVFNRRCWMLLANQKSLLPRKQAAEIWPPSRTAGPNGLLT